MSTKIIDAHAHFFADRPEALPLLAKFDIKAINLCFDDGDDLPWTEQADFFCGMANSMPDRFAWCTTFGVDGFGEADYAERVIAGLDRDFARGAIGVKVWKNIGMELRNASGQYVTLDDPAFEPIFAHLEAAERTVVLHTADPVRAWQKIDPLPMYIQNNPKWYMYLKPDAPSHADLMAARMKVMDRHPKLLLIGAHFGSEDKDFATLDRRLEQYPHYVMGIGGRTPELAFMDHAVVRDFLIRWQDRLTFGTDFGPAGRRQSDLSEEQFGKFIEHTERDYTAQIDFYFTDKLCWFYGEEFPGLALPDDVLEKLFYTNTKRLFPDLPF